MAFMNRSESKQLTGSAPNTSDAYFVNTSQSDTIHFLLEDVAGHANTTAGAIVEFWGLMDDYSSEAAGDWWLIDVFTVPAKIVGPAVIPVDAAGIEGAGIVPFKAIYAKYNGSGPTAVKGRLVSRRV
jgi:hypothetical protein